MDRPGRRASQELRLLAPGKVNLYFEILGKRPDGYHEIRTVMQTVSLFDELQFERLEGEELRLLCSDAELPADEENLVVRAGRLLQERCGVEQGAAIRLVKRIPVGGGMGGGSSDAAHALLGLSELWGLDVTQSDLAGLAAELGSDVPFFIYGGTALCEGRGERVTPLSSPVQMHYVIIMPRLHVSTAEVYASVRTVLTTRSVTSNNVLVALEKGDWRMVSDGMQNDLQPIALSLHPDLRQLWSELKAMKERCGLRALLLSGSGACFFAVAPDEECARRAAALLESELSVPCAAAHTVGSRHSPRT